MRVARSAAVVLVVAVAIGWCAAVVAPGDVGTTPNPSGGPPIRLSPLTPADLVFDESGDPDTDRRTFANFSWRDFIALNWPAGGARGEPDTDLSFGDRAGNVVWGSWKSTSDLFPPDADTNPPTEWGAYDPTVAVARRVTDGANGGLRFEKMRIAHPGRDYVLDHLKGLSHVNEAGIGTPQGPLIAQNGTYVRYEVRLNRVAYDFIRDSKYYLQANLPNGPNQQSVDPARRVHFPTGSMIVKASWMELTDSDPRGRFYHVRANLVDRNTDGSPKFREAVVGLVGLHIAHRVPTRPSWVWSTFEHVDNTEPGPGGPRASFSRNLPETKNDLGYDYKPECVPEGTVPPPNPRPVDVLKFAPAHPVTKKMNRLYHQHEGVRDTVWKYYDLVTTQWVKPPDRGEPLESSNRRFPPEGVTNSTIETYMQSFSCIDCHANTKDFRFVFFPTFLARPPTATPRP